MVMRRDPTEFRKRFKAYQSGKSVKEIYDGGYIKEPVITPDPQYNEYINSLPDNQRLTPESAYRSHRYWELNGKPKNFAEAIGKGMFNYDFTDYGWHANSVALNPENGEYEFMKPNWHDTKMYEDTWYYSKDGEGFRSEYTKKPGVAYDKYLPKHKNGKLPGYGDGKDPIDQSRIDAREQIEQAVQLSQNSTFGKRNLSPESYYLRYRNSEGFRKRFDTGYGEEGAFYRLGIDQKKVPAIKYGDNDGSMYIPNQNLVYMGSNTNDDYAKLGLHNRDFVKAHEQAHSIYNDGIFGNNDSGMLGRPVEQYMKLNTPNLSNYRSWVDKNNNYKVDFSHDSRGIEGGADIGALGYLLYNDGVFNRMDPKSKITTEQLDEWYKNYQQKNPNNPYLRPLENYGTEKAAWLLNNTASVQKKPTSGLLHAKNGKLPKYAGGKDPYEEVVDFLRQHEGYRDKVYLDGNGIPTIGYGFTDAKFVNKGTISRADADAELKRQIKTRQSTLRDILGADKWDSLTDDSRKALTSYHYNYPAGFKSNTKFMKAWRAGNYAEAIRQVDAGMNDPKNPGLRTRRLAEQALLKADPFLTGRHEVPMQPIIAQPVSTAVRPTIPEQHTIPAYDTRISPYISGKPMLHLMPTVNMPDLIQMIEDSQWQPTYSDGKLPGYADGKIHIKPSKRGTFTAAAKKHGASVREFESRVLKNPEKYSTAMVKKARFSRNARSWKH